MKMRVIWLAILALAALAVTVACTDTETLIGPTQVPDQARRPRAAFNNVLVFVPAPTDKCQSRHAVRVKSATGC